YLRVEGLAVPAHVHAAAREFRYAARVFLAPPWPAIYRTDEERKQPAELAERTCEAVADAYAEHGYELVELPRLPVAERARFVLDSVEQ
ncbi:MAG: AAA family ATPase, partial [Saccharopolyspora sp.]|uniref:AAA family ATPase n=1 Tax=Saccharopolyspora sp. TaxID=33915 RepID=UPI0025CFC7D2